MNTNGLILAAGFSSRAKGFKMLFNIDGKSIVRRTIGNLLPFCQKIFVVTGYKSELLEKELKDIPKVTIVRNDAYEKGMYSSVCSGFAYLTDCDNFFFTPGDIPFVKRETLEKMLKIKDDIVVPSYEMKAGHPVLLSKNILVNYQMSENLREHLKSFQKTYLNVPDKGILLDCDTQEDYERLKNLGTVKKLHSHLLTKSGL